MINKRKEDKLKNLLWGNRDWGFAWPEEVKIWRGISPVASIKVVWVGWAWQNAVNRMIEGWLEWVEFVSINTDTQALYNSLAPTKLNIWKIITQGLWAWADPEIGKKSAEESREDIKNALSWADMVFITCGLGWGTWTGAAPVVAEVAKELWALTVWIVTKPFSFEWQNRMSKSIDGYNNLKEKVDTLITIPNDRILSIIDKKTPLLDAFSIVDEILNQWVQGVSDLITQPGLINVDFADVTSVMKNAWSALMGIGYWSGENRAIEAARAAIDSPLLELSIAGAKWLLFNITGGTDLSMFEVDEAAKIITESVDTDANIIFGATINEEYNGELKITVVATWFDEDSNRNYSEWAKLKVQSSPNPFGRKPVTDSRISPTINTNNQTSTSNQSNMWNTTTNNNDDLDIPSFLRRKM